MAEKPIPFNAESVRGLMTCAQCGHVTALYECPDCGCTERVKRQTRRVITKWPPKIHLPRPVRTEAPLVFGALEAKPGIYQPKSNKHGALSVLVGDTWLGVKPGEFEWVARYAVGDTLWVREAWARVYREEDCIANEFDDRPLQCEDCNGCLIEYKADTGNKYPGDWPDDAGDDPMCGRWHSPRHMWKYLARIRLTVTRVRAERLHDISGADAVAEGVGCGFQLNGGWPDYRYIGDDGACRLTQDTARMSYATWWDSINAKRGYPWSANPWVFAYDFEEVSDE